MATLIKLQICGIRSFSPVYEQIQQISFDTPVTLLVGQNGCGKTTILEAIKYVCTGDLPGGTSKGQGFVHYPRISNSAITKGVIKLKLIDVNNDTYTIVKTVQLQQKASSLSFSSLDSALKIEKANGDVHEITGRCADIDKQCAQILRVSPCILNNVLFCHQENSSWPLDEGKKVKEKFDEIFDSKKYNKCAEILIKTTKAGLDKLKLLRLEVDSKKEKKDEVSRKRFRLQEKKDKLASILDKIEKKNQSLGPHKKRLTEISQIEGNLSELHGKRERKRAEGEGIDEQIKMLKESITIQFDGTDDELKGEILSFEEKQKEKEKSIKCLEDNKKQIVRKEDELDDSIQKVQMKLGQLKEERNQYEAKCMEQNGLLEKLKISLGMQENLSLTTPEESETTIDYLKVKIKQIDDDFEKLIKGKHEEESDLQGKIDEIRESLATTKEKLQTTLNEIRKSDEKNIQLTNELQELNITSKKLKEIDEKIIDLTRTLSNIQNKYDENKSETEIKLIKKEIIEMERKLEELDELYKILQDNYIIEEKLNTEEQILLERKTEINKINNKHKNNFKELFDDVIPKEKISKKVESLIQLNESEIKKMNGLIGLKQKEVTKLETEIQHQIQDIKRSEDDLNKKNLEINSICKGKPFNSLIKETYEKKEKLQKDKGSFNSAKIMYEQFILKFEKDKPCCPVCESDFTEKRSIVKSIIEKLKEKIKNIPEKLKETEIKLKNEEQFYNKLQQLKNINESIEMLGNATIPLMNEQLDENKKSLEVLNGSLKELNGNLEKPVKIVEICRKVLKDAVLLDKHIGDVVSYEKSIVELKKKVRSVDVKRSKQEVECELDNLKADLSNHRKKYETLRSKLDQHKQRCEKIKEDKNQQLELQLKYRTKANNKPNLEKQLEELKDNQGVLLVNKEEENEKLKEFEGMLKKMNQEKLDLKNRNQRIINEKRNDLNRKHKLLDEIVKLSKGIKDYQNKGSSKDIDVTIDKLSEYEEKKKKLIDLKNKTIDEIFKQKEEIAKQITNLRNLNDNLLIKEKLKLKQVIDEELIEYDKKIKEHQYNTIRQEKTEIIKLIDEKEGKINNLKGQEKELKTTINDIETELKLTENKYAEKNYLYKFYELKVMEKNLDDLKLYTKALQTSILQFHKEKMVQINQRIRELWRNIYQGNDIDYIQINAEESKGHNPSKQCYDYKVIQVKNGIKLEMRGRCSAGQRVLACLIIRMALAESFSSHCGILALDEPTTNLDKENITSLTQALTHIITTHQTDNKFQLIVITHDQSFLNILRQNVQNVSHYWSISRNPQGYSVIKKKRL